MHVSQSKQVTWQCGCWQTSIHVHNGPYIQIHLRGVWSHLWVSVFLWITKINFPGALFISGSVQCHVSETLVLTAPACPAETWVFHAVACQVRSPPAGTIRQRPAHPPDTQWTEALQSCMCVCVQYSSTQTTVYSLSLMSKRSCKCLRGPSFTSGTQPKCVSPPWAISLLTAT